MSRKLLGLLLTLLLACWLLMGCGSSDGQMTAATASRLQWDVDAVVSAAEASRWDTAIDALDQLEADVARAQAAGALSEERAAQIRAVRQRVLEDLLRIRRPSPTPPLETTPQTTPSTETHNNDRNDGQTGKSKDDDQGEDGGGNHKGKDKREKD